jgi:hypothetical protein
MSPLTTRMAALDPGGRTWIETTLDDYKALMSRVTTTTHYHRCIRGRTFSASLYTAVRGVEVVYLVCVTRVT